MLASDIIQQLNEAFVARAFNTILEKVICPTIGLAIFCEGASTVHILDHQAPGLSKTLQGLSLGQRRRLLGSICESVFMTLSPPDGAIQDLITKIKSCQELSPAELEQARQQAKRADDRYLSLKEQGAEVDAWFFWFVKARLLSAISSGFGATSWEDGANCLYELSVTKEDSTEILDLVRDEVANVLNTR